MGCRNGCALGCLGILVAVVTANPLIGIVIVVGGWLLDRMFGRKR